MPTIAATSSVVDRQSNMIFRSLPMLPEPMTLSDDYQRNRVSASTVQRIWHARGLKPYRIEAIKLTNQPAFEGKLIDVVGLAVDLAGAGDVLMDGQDQAGAGVGAPK